MTRAILGCAVDGADDPLAERGQLGDDEARSPLVLPLTFDEGDAVRFFDGNDEGEAALHHGMSSTRFRSRSIPYSHRGGKGSVSCEVSAGGPGPREHPRMASP